MMNQTCKKKETYENSKSHEQIETNKEDFRKLPFTNNSVHFADEKDAVDFRVKSDRRSPYFINFGTINFSNFSKTIVKLNKAIKKIGKYFAKAVLDKEDFCKLLFTNDAVYFADEKDHSDFKVKSGRRSPYFINFGALNFGQAIEELGKYFADAVLEELALHHADKEPIVIFGPAYKGIPLCLTTAMALSRKEKNVFYCFNRKEEKDHGEGGSFLGHIPSGGEKVFIVDDVLTSGLSINHSIDILTKDGKIKEENIFVVVGVDRMEMGRRNKKAKDEIEQRLKKKIKCIANIKDILEVGKRDSFLKEKNIEEIENYLAEVNKELSKK